MPTFRKNIRRPSLNNEETSLSGISGSFIPTGDAVLKAGDTMTGTLTMDAADILGDGTTIWVEGHTYGSGPDAAPGPYVAEGEGTRLLFIQDSGMYGAFRAGYVSGDKWDISKIGIESAAFGEDTQASGFCDFACGLNNTISSTGGQNFVTGANNSITTSAKQNTVGGINNTVAGAAAIGNSVFGVSNNATYYYGVALGQLNTVGTASGAVAIGVSNTSSNGGAICLGTTNTNSGQQSSAIGKLNLVTAESAVAIGTSNTVDTATSVAIGRLLDTNLKTGVTMLGNSPTSFEATTNYGFYVLAGTTTPLIDIDPTVGVIRTNLTIAGTLTSTSGRIKKTRRITATDTILATDDVVFCNTATAYTVTLPTGAEGQTLRIINSGTSSNTLTVKPFAGQDLIGIADNSFLLYDGESLEITYNATDGWY